MNRYDTLPDIMAIGDSMYQGIRTLSFLPAMTQHSAPMQVAAALGMQMVAPDLQRPLLFDMEAEMRSGGLLHLIEHIRGVCLANLHDWPNTQPWSQHEAFDNVAIGGARIDSLWDDTDTKYFATLPALEARLADTTLSVPQLATTIGDLWYALNTCYTLNPRHRPEQAGTSQLDQVAHRKPQVLLINIGSNEGLFMAGFTGDVGAGARGRLANVPDLVGELADRLAALPDRVERIVFNNLIRPRFIPNLMPSPAHENDAPGDGYFDAYGARIGSGQQDIAAADLRSFDELVADVNQRSAAILKARLGDRVAVVDLYTHNLPYDGKHYAGRGLVIPGKNKTLNNKPITEIPFGYYGGFASLDNMHPTSPGYAAIADEVLTALGRNDVRTDKTAAYTADTLLNDLPNLLQLLIEQGELSLLGVFGVFRLDTPAAAAPAVA